MKNINLYTVDELQAYALRKALDEHRYIQIENVSWYDFIVEDAKPFGIDIKNCDINNGVDLEFNKSPLKVAKTILNEVPDNDDLFYHSSLFLFKMEIIWELKDSCKYSEKRNEFIDDFKNSIKKYYFEILSTEYQDLISDESVKKFLLENDYYFLQDGTFLAKFHEQMSESNESNYFITNTKDVSGIRLSKTF